MKSFIKTNGISISILMIWFFVNLICLVMSSNSDSSKDYFFPFELRENSITENYEFSLTYDFTEFLVYGISPILVFVVLKLISNDKKDN